MVQTDVLVEYNTPGMLSYNSNLTELASWERWHLDGLPDSDEAL